MLATTSLNPSTRSMQALLTEWWRMTILRLGIDLGQRLGRQPARLDVVGGHLAEDQVGIADRAHRR